MTVVHLAEIVNKPDLASALPPSPRSEDFAGDSRRRRRRYWLIGIVIVVVTAVVAVAYTIRHLKQFEHRVAAHIERAVEFRDKDQHAAAVVELKNALQIQPEDADARLHLGQAYLVLGDGLSAEKEFRQVIALGKTSAASELGLLQAKLLQGQFKDVLEGLQWLDSDDPQAALMRGQALVGLKRFDEADTVLKAIVDQSAVAIKALQASALVDVASSDLDAGMNHIDAAIQLADDDLQSWLIKSNIAFASADFEAAKSAAERALELENGNVAATTTLIESLLRLNRPNETEPHLEQLERAFPKQPTIHYLRAKAAVQLDDLVRARRAFEAVLLYDPKHRDGLFELASLNFSEQAYGEAQTVLERLLELEPDHLPSQKLLASVQAATKQYSAAAITLKTALRQAPGEADLFALLSNVYASMGEFDKSSEALTRAAKLSSDQGWSDASAKASTEREQQEGPIANPSGDPTERDREDARRGLLRGAMLVERKDYNGAIEVSKSLRAKVPGSPLPSYLAGNAYEGLGQFEQAVVAYEQALEIDPRFTAAVTRLARLALQADDTDGARARFQTALEDNPHHPELLTGMARMELTAGREDEWLRLLEESRERNPTDVGSRLELADFYLGKEPPKALSLAEEALRIDPQAEATILTMARAELDNGLIERALNRFSTLSEPQRKSVRVLAVLGHAQELAGALEDARESYETALRVDQNGHLWLDPDQERSVGKGLVDSPGGRRHFTG